MSNVGNADYYRAYCRFSATTDEQNGNDWDNTSAYVIYGNGSPMYRCAAVMMFSEPDVEGETNLTGSRKLDGLAIVDVEFNIWRYRTQNETHITGSLYYLSESVDTEMAWWINVEPRIGGKADVTTWQQPGTGSSLTKRTWSEEVQGKSGQTLQDWCAKFVLGAKHGLVLRANYSNIHLVGDKSVIPNERGSASTIPYLRFKGALVLPVAQELSPSGGYLDPRKDGTLHWKFGYDATNVWGEVWQDGATVQIRPAGGQIIEYAVQGRTSSYTIPAGTMTTSYDWRVCVRSMHNVQSVWPEWCAVTTIDSLSEPVPLAPRNMFVDAARDTQFSWTHSIATGTDSTLYELQYSKNNTDWTALASGTGAAQSCIVTAGSLVGGNVYWRVRTANADNVWGVWSAPAPIVVQSPPAAPVLTLVTGTTRPTLHWQSAEQQGYQVMVDDASTGTLYGVEKSFVWPEILPDGIHTVAVRVVNRFTLWSAWTRADFAVANLGGVEVTLLAQVRTYDIVLRWTDTGKIHHIYRDGERIASAATSPFTDHTAYGKHTYHVRAIGDADDYVDSKPVVAYLRLPLKDAAIAAIGTWDWIDLLENEGDDPALQVTHTPTYASNFYSGRRLPVIESGTHESITHGFAYALTSPCALRKLLSLRGRMVCFKRGEEMLQGYLPEISQNMHWWGSAVSFQIVEVSNAEG